MSFGILPSVSGNVINNNFNGGSNYQVGALVVWKQQLYFCKAAIPAVTDHWDPNYNSAAFSLDATQLIATLITPNTTATIRNLRTNTTGKFYFEYQLSFNPGAVDIQIGIMTNAANNVSLRAASPGTSIGLETFGAPNAWNLLSGNAVFAASPMPTPASGAWIGFALNMPSTGNISMWMTNVTLGNGLYYGTGTAGVTGDPVAGTNAFTRTVFGAPAFIVGCSNQNGGTQTIPINVSSFQGAPPAGYTGWSANLTPDQDPSHWGLIAPNPPPTTFAALPSNVVSGETAIITDSASVVAGAIVTAGGGANTVLMWYNGTNWKILQAL